MIIKKVIDGVEREIELSKQEMINIACELDILNIVDGMDDFMANFDIDGCDEEVLEKYQKYLDAPLEVCKKFWRDCAEGIISLAEERYISLADDLTDIYDEVVIEELMKFESEEN